MRETVAATIASAQNMGARQSTFSVAFFLDSTLKKQSRNDDSAHVTGRAPLLDVPWGTGHPGRDSKNVK